MKHVLYYSLFFILLSNWAFSQSVYSTNQSGVDDKDPVSITITPPAGGGSTIVSISSTSNSTLEIAPATGATSYAGGVNAGGSSFSPPQIQTSLTLGTIDGKPNVGNDGSANYTIPISLPPGTNGMVPSLNLQYNSKAREGVMGLGWSFNQSSIVRVNRDYYHNNNVCHSVSLDNNDALSFDGNRMYVTSGTNLNIGCTYHLENENYSRITYQTAASGENYFYIETKQGLKMEYGSTADSKVSFVSGASKIDYEFFLTKVYDNYGNYILYTYNNDGTNHEVTLKQIDYTGNSTLSLNPYNSIKFYYDTKDVNSDEIKFVDGYKITQTQLLNEIDVVCGTSYIKKYNFTYAENNYHNYLNQIDYTDFDGNKLNPTVFGYGGTGYTGSCNVSSAGMVWCANATLPYGVSGGNGLNDADMYTGDFNGDGITDLVAFPYNSITCDNNTAFQIIKTYESNFLIYTGSNGSGFSSTSVAFPSNFMFYYPSSSTAFGGTEFFPRNYIASSNPQQFGPTLRDFTGDEKTDIAVLTTGSANKMTVNIVQPLVGAGGTSNVTTCTLNFWERIIFADIDGDKIPEGIIYNSAVNNSNSPVSATLKAYSFKNSQFLNLGNPINVTGTIATASSWNTSGKTFDGISALDVNGDGTDELYVVYEGSAYYIRLALSGSSFTATSFWQSPNNIDVTLTGPADFYGDFNGDGINDVARAGISSPPENLPPGSGGNNVKVFYGLGNDEGFQTSSAYAYSDANDYGDIQRAYLTADINGDGKTDLVEIYGYNCFNSNPITPKTEVYYWDSNKPGSKTLIGTISGYSSILNYLFNTPNLDYDFDSQAGFTGTKDISIMPVFLTGDFNGDGRDDIIFKIGNSFQASASCSTPSTAYVIASLNPFNTEHLLTDIYDGYGRQTTFTYKSTAEYSSTIYSASANTPPAKTKKCNDAMWVVSEMDNPDGIGGTNTETYTYKGGVMHLQGKGFLGYDQMTTANSVTNITSTSIYTINTTYFERYPQSTTNKLTSSPYTTVNTITYAYPTLSPTGGSGYGHFSYLKTQKNVDNATTGFVTQVSSTYNNDGNVTNKVITNGSSTPSTTFETTTISTNNFSSNGTWLPTLPEDITSTTQRGTNAAYSRTINYVYTSQGKVQTETSDQGKPLYVQIDYGYDGTGNINSKKTQAPSGGLSGALPVKNYTYEYDNLKRFISKTTNPLGQVSYSGFDERYGSLIYTKDITSLETYLTYDGEGRLIKKVTPDNITTNTTYNWVTSAISTTGEPISNYGQYLFHYATSTTTHKPTITTYFDIFNREISTITDGFTTNKPIYAVKTYDAFGNVSGQTGPYYKGTGNALTGLVTTNAYDSYQRLHNSQTTYQGLANPNTTSYAYAIDGSGNYQTTVTMPDTRTKQTFVDPSGLTVKTINDLGETVNFDYWSNRKTKTVSLGGGSAVTEQMTYDDYARPYQLTEPNSGTSTYFYDAYGLLESSIDGRNVTITSTYDMLDRITSKVSPDGNFAYQYVTSGNGLNLLQIETAPGGSSYSYNYDNLNRLKQKTDAISGNQYVTAYQYDQYNNITNIIYPGGFGVTQDYNNISYLTDIKDNNNNLIWQGDEMIPFAQYNKYTLGNGHQTVVTYNNFDMPTKYDAGNIFKYGITPDITNGNITDRSDLLRGITESFGYDHTNRLTTNTINTDVTTVAYETTGTGNIHSKASSTTNGSNLGVYAYQNNAFNQLNTVENLDATISANTQSATYNSFSKLTNVSEGDYTYDISYGPDMQRVQSILTNVNTGTQLKRDYVPNYEKTTSGNNYSREVNYIQAPSGLCAMYVKNGSNDTLYFVYTDHLGSILKLTDAGGTARAEQSFDPWGRYRNPTDWTYTNVLIPNGITYRGFTGHEHLPQFDLINMNGRVYDSKLGLFLSVDPLMDKTPGISPYHYANNNPLKFTDPLGMEASDWFKNLTTGMVKYEKDVVGKKGEEVSLKGSKDTWVNIGKTEQDLDVVNAKLNYDTKTKMQFQQGGAIKQSFFFEEQIMGGIVAKNVLGPIFKYIGAKLFSSAATTTEQVVVNETTNAIAPYYPPNRGALGDWSKITLETGTKIDRFGSGYGKYFSPEGTPLEMRALPPGNTGGYNAYEVIKPFQVETSTIAPWFGKPGTGIQYYSPYLNANELIQGGFIKPTP